MSHSSATARRASVAAGAGRPVRFTLVLEEDRGALHSWLGGRWAAMLGGGVVSLFGLAGAVLGAVDDAPGAGPEVLGCAGAGVGAVVVALHLRPRRVLFRRRGETWWWGERRFPGLARWSAITEEMPLRLEREILSTVEGFTLYAGTVRLFSYLGDPATGRNVSAAFQTAGVPLRTVMKRPPAGE